MNDAAPATDSAPLLLLACYSVAISAAALLGGWLPSLIRFTHVRMQVIISYVGGLMLGIAVFHLLPHALVEIGPERIDEISWAMMIGMMVMFFLLRAFHFHHHGEGDFADASLGETHGQGCHGGHHHHDGHKHAADHRHEADPVTPCGHQDQCDLGRICKEKGEDDGSKKAAMMGKVPIGAGQWNWLGVLTGLGYQTLLDGVALAAAVESDFHGEPGWSLWGVGVFLAILLHKPLDAISIASLMRSAGWSASSRFLVIFGFSLMIPLGILLANLGWIGSGQKHGSMVAWGLGFSAGVFFCIALSDLLPEMEFHSHNRIRLTIALILGLATAVGIGYLEPKHAHAPRGGVESHSHEGDGHHHSH